MLCLVNSIFITLVLVSFLMTNFPLFKNVNQENSLYYYQDMTFWILLLSLLVNIKHQAVIKLNFIDIVENSIYKVFFN